MDLVPLRVEFMQVLQRFGRLNLSSVLEGITKGEFVMLEILHADRAEHPDHTGMYVSKLVEQMDVTAPAVSRMLRQLEGKGLIERSVDMDNRRNTFIHITCEGMRTHSRMQKKLQAFTQGVIERMGEEDMRALLSLWARFADIMDLESTSFVKGSTDGKAD